MASMTSVTKTAQRFVRRAAGCSLRLATMETAAVRRLAVARPFQTRCFASAPSGKDDEFVALSGGDKSRTPSAAGSAAPTVTHAEALDDDLDDDDDMEEVVAIGPSGVEYGGPTRGGQLKEPTRYGDWERKGRCSDF